MDRKGRMFTAEECREELADYKKRSKKYATVNKRPAGVKLQLMKLHAQYIYKKAYLCKIGRGVMRRVGRVRSQNEKRQNE